MIKPQSIMVKDLKHFDLAKTLESGQCFRWEKIDEGQYMGTAYHRTIKVGQIGSTLYIDHSNAHDFNYIWLNYFDLNRDYGKINEALSTDTVMKKAVIQADGLHILQQEAFETLITYIISANNNIPRIKKIIKTLCDTKGEKHMIGGKEFATFPSAFTLYKASKEEIDLCRAGFRCKYIMATAKKVYESKFKFEALSTMDYQKAKDSLKQFSGVGDKVADCVLLFTAYHTDSFPVDVWIKRVMEEYYFHKEMKVNDIALYARSKFGKYAGFANNYLFYYSRQK